MTRTIPELLSVAVSRSPDKEFLIFNKFSYSYRLIDLLSSALAGLFLKQGISKGDHVALFLPNCPEFILAWFALAKLGAVMVPINPSYKTAELTHLLTHSDSKLVVTTPELQNHLPPILPLFLTSRFPSQSSLSKSSNKPAKPFSTLSPEDVVSILYTSGSTGRPKGVVLPHRSYVIGGESFAYRAKLTDQDRLLTMLPLFHVNAEIYSVMGALVAGATIVLLDHFSASSFWSTVRDHKITQFNFLGVIANILLKQPVVSEETKHHVRLACGAGLSKSTLESFTSRFGFPILETYGLTEVPMGTSNLLSDSRPGSIGKPSRHPDPKLFTKVRLEGKTGEILLSSPALAHGYYQDPVATKLAFQAGWFHTGDLGKLDADGYYYFLDRLKDIIRKKGENISSREIELVIGELKEVAEVAVIPIPASLGEDDIKAYIVLKEGYQLSAQNVKSHCLKYLSSQKTPALVEFVASLPHTPTAKLAKNELKTLFLKTQTSRLVPRAYLVGGVRTPIAKVGMAFKDIRTDELLALTLTELAKRFKITEADDLLVGCVNQVGEGERNLARQALLLSSLSQKTPAATITRLSASGLEAVRLAFAGIAGGLSNSVIIGGVESFSRTPDSSRLGYPHLHPHLKKDLFSSGELIELMTREEGISREELDSYAFNSNSRSLSAESKLKPYLLSVAGLTKDEVPRLDLTLKRLSELPPLYNGLITAGNSSKLGDCAASALLASPQYCQTHSLTPLVGLVGFSLVAGDPQDYGRLPVLAVNELLNKHDLTTDHIDIWEIHEAYATVALYVARHLSLRPDRINRWGGAISLGHPFGATGLNLLLSAAHQLKESDSQYAVVVICIGGGQAMACLLSKFSSF